MKISESSKTLSGLVFIVGDQVICAVCREPLIDSLVRICPVCKNLLRQQINIDTSVRFTRDLFDLLYPQNKDLYDMDSDFREYTVVAEEDCDRVVLSTRAQANRKQHQTINRLHRSGIPLKYIERAESDFCCCGFAEASLSMFDLFHSKRSEDVLYLWGDNSTGKTLLASLYLKDRILKGDTGKFVMFDDVISKALNSWWAEDSEISRILTADVVVVDDAFDESKVYVKPGTPGLPLLDHFFRYRVQNGLLTIVTSNQDLSRVSDPFLNIRRLIERSYVEIRLLYCAHQKKVV